MKSKTAKIDDQDLLSVDTESLENDSAADEKGELDELRRLLVHPNEVSSVLPAAVAQSSKKDRRLGDAMLPIVEENIRESVRQNPDVLADALFPAIGPAIRKAISEALSQMIQSLNQTLENSVSPKGLRWRIEAWQTGKPFAEVVLLNSLVYRVEEVFLIHRETGGLLQHASVQKNVSEDADMVSAMLTAIQDFAHDSFKESEDANLDSLQLNDLSVWIERSPDAILAGVIRGNPPLTLREIFKEAIEAIQFVQRSDFDAFTGDISAFERSKPMLDNCLQFQLNKGEKKTSIFSPTNLAAAAAAILLLIFGFIYIRDYWRWSNYLTRLHSEPGIAVTESDLGWWKDSISGLRDPLAIDPDAILNEYNLKRNYVKSEWKPYQDLGPEMILARANSILKPPTGTSLTFDNGILRVGGIVSNEWFADARDRYQLISGVTGFTLSNETLQNRIQSQRIGFSCGTLDYSNGAEAKLTETTQDLEMLASSGVKWQLEVLGYADLTGSEKTNSQISNARSQKVVADLLKSDKLKGFSESIKNIGLGASEATDCTVAFKVTVETK